MPDSSNYAPAPLRRAARIMQVVCWCALIFWASDTPNLRVTDDDLLDLVARKLAHLTAFGTLAILVARATRPDAPIASSTLVIAWITTLAWAISDEWHQTFVVGRVGHASDVVIDMVGATIGLAIWRFAVTRTRRREGARS